MGALWAHSGQAEEPHLLIDSEVHSNSYFDSTVLEAKNGLFRECCHDLMLKLVQNGFAPKKVNRVICPKEDGKMAYKLASVISELRAKPCLWSELPLPVPIKANEEILLCMEVIDRSDPVLHMLHAAQSGNCSPLLAVLLNTCRVTEAWSQHVVSLVDHEIKQWPVSRCPLCESGSKPVSFNELKCIAK